VSAQPARVIPLPHRPSHRTPLGTPLESFALEGIGSVPDANECTADEPSLSDALEALGRDEQAEAARRLAGTLQTEPGNAEALLALGAIQHTRGDATAASESYRRATVADPASWRPLYNEALLREAAGASGEAIALLYHAIALAPLEAAPQFRLALMLESGGQDAEARVWWKRTVSSDPSLTSAWLRLGLLELRGGRLPDAAIALENALGGDQEAADAAYHLALAHIGMGAAQEAFKALAEALHHDPNAADAHAALVGLALDSDDLDRAERHEHALRALEPTPAVLSLRLAQAWAMRGELELAQEHYKRAVQSDSSLAVGYFALTL